MFPLQPHHQLQSAFKWCICCSIWMNDCLHKVYIMGWTLWWLYARSRKVRQGHLHGGDVRHPIVDSRPCVAPCDYTYKIFAVGHPMRCVWYCLGKVKKRHSTSKMSPFAKSNLMEPTGYQILLHITNSKSYGCMYNGTNARPNYEVNCRALNFCKNPLGKDDQNCLSPSRASHPRTFVITSPTSAVDLDSHQHCWGSSAAGCTMMNRRWRWRWWVALCTLFTPKH